MKTTRKLLAMVLAVIMVMSLATTAFATMEGNLTGGSITIENPVDGQTYSAYQILYLESYNASANTYVYKANSAWADWLAEQTDYVTIDAQGYVTWVNGANVDAFAKAAQTQLSSKTADATATASGTTVTLSNLNLGYYLVDTTLGTLCSLDTTNPNVVMEEKNEVPTVTKEVQEDSDNSWGETNDADINQVVNYKATITVQTGAENYVLYDNMSAGLTWNGTVEVTVNGVTVDASNYTVTQNVNVGDVTYDFAVAFKNEYIETLTAGTQIEVTYSATLNEDAVVGLEGNPNEVILKYGDENKPSWTPKDETITYTWDVKIIKYTVNDNKEILLSGATFQLTTDAAGKNVLKFHNLGNNKYEHCADADCDKQHVTEITTDATGTFYIEGLDADTYYLHETVAPSGYNKLAGPIEVKITGATADDEGKLTYTTVEQKVLNQSGTELPSTGGMGTTMFYFFGAVLMIGAAVLLVTKRRMNIAE